MSDIEQQCEELTKMARADVNKAIEESGISKAEWSLLKEGRKMLGEWALMQEKVKQQHGIELENLLEGVTVNLIATQPDSD